MPTPYCPTCDAATTDSSRYCERCDTERPVEGWPEDPLVGRVFLDTYTVIRRLGSGGFGVVYLAENTEFGGKRAIKVLDARYVHDDNVLRRFRREAKALYQLQSPYTVRVERWGRTDDGHYYLVMEFAEGETLRQLLEREGRLEEKRALSIVRQTAVALADAHALGILHRDLKPENLVIREHPHEGDRVAVLDFGISKILEDDSVTNRSGLVGTPSYMAPECWNPALGPQDIRADLWSLGVMFFEMLVGTLPFEGDSSSPDAMTTAFRIANLEPEQISDALDLRSVHSHTRRIVTGLLQRRPDQRYPTPDPLLEDIDRHLLWAASDRKTFESRSPARERDDMATADTIPDLPAAKLAQSRADSLFDTIGEVEREADDFSFADEPPEHVTIRRSVDAEDQAEERRKPSLNVILVALVVLGLLAVGVRFGDRILEWVGGAGTAPDAGPIASEDGSASAEDAGIAAERPVVIQNPDGMGAALVPGGAVQIGVDSPASLVPAHRVVLEPFYLDEREVTAGMWLECVQRGGCPAELATPASEQAQCPQLDGSLDDSVLPMSCVSWFGADAYCRAYGRRLPTEAEWERAATLEAEQAEDGGSSGSETTAPRHLVGGLREWVGDWYSSDYYDVSPTIDPTGSIFGTRKVARGGPVAEGEPPAWAARHRFEPDQRNPDLGFRCAAALPAD